MYMQLCSRPSLFTISFLFIRRAWCIVLEYFYAPYAHARTMGDGNMKWLTTRRLVRGALIAALYTALTLALAPISFGPLQLRVSEALSILPILLPEAIPGLFVGCLLSNLIAGQPWQDVVFGSLATLIAGCLTYLLRKRPLLAALPPVAVNAVVIGIVLWWTLNLPLLLTMGEIALGQIGACYVLGIPLLLLLKRLPEGTLRA